jgi:hypothetical protein
MGCDWIGSRAAVVWCGCRSMLTVTGLAVSSAGCLSDCAEWLGCHPTVWLLVELSSVCALHAIEDGVCCFM